MYRSLNIDSLGITGRQSELIEMALSYRFKGLELDMEAFARKVESRGLEHANRCIASAKKTKVGLNVDVWHLPIRWSSDEESLQTQINRIPGLANSAKQIESLRCVTIVEPGSDTLPQKDNFDFYSSKLTEICEMLAPHGVTLGVGFKAAQKAREGYEFEFVTNVEQVLSLISLVKSDNVGLYLDTWNWHLGGGTVDQVLSHGVDKLVAVAVADVPADATAESIELGQRLLPDPSGVIPHADLLTKLHEAEFEGPVAAVPHISQYKGIKRDKLVSRVADALRSVWPGADLLEEAELEAEEAGGQPGEGKEAAAKEAEATGEAKEQEGADKPAAEEEAAKA